MILALDTASDRLSVALGATAADALTAHVDGARRHAAEVLPAVQRLLDHAGVSLDAVGGVVVADGPGSFTGLRVAASVLKALVAARGIAAWRAPSLMARAAALGPGAGPVVALADALRGEAYGAVYEVGPAGVSTRVPPAARTVAALRRLEPRPAAVVGLLPPALREEAAGWAPQVVLDRPVEARWLLDLVGRDGGAVRIDRPEEWEPDYGRPAEAQARWEARHGRQLPDPARAGG